MNPLPVTKYSAVFGFVLSVALVLSWVPESTSSQTSPHVGRAHLGWGLQGFEILRGGSTGMFFSDFSYFTTSEGTCKSQLLFLIEKY